MNDDRRDAGPGEAHSSFDASSDAAAQLDRLRRALADRYVIEREIGHGGTANVYRAHDLRRDAWVALKVLRPELSAAFGAARFVREVEIGQRLDHPNILRVIESGAAGADLYYTMPVVDGSTLRARLREERQLSLDDAVSIVRQVAAALDYAHAHGIIHRDITPGNILLDGTRVLVADLGIARAMTVLSGEKITGSGISLGTPEYMSPEQATGEQWIDGRTDIYSLGCVLYEMLAGEPPFTGPSAQAIVARHCKDAPRSLRVTRPAIPPGLERFIMKALSKVPADRFSSAGAMIEALDAIDLNERTRATSTWSRGRLGVVALTVIVVGVGALATSLITRPPRIVLDPLRIVVFPLRDALGSAGVRPEDSGEGVARYIGISLDRTRPLQWREGSDLMSGRGLKPSQLTEAVAETLSVRAGAGYFIDGTIVRHPDSTTLMLTAHDVRRDTAILTVRETAASPAFLPGLGERAIKQLLPAILDPGRHVDLRSLSQSPSAIANFLQGEGEYRHMQFQAALNHYSAAVRDDSAFAIAAFRGAQAETWLSETDTTLLDVALRRPQLLLPPEVMLAHGLRAYVTGDADSAVVYLELAVRADSAVASAWALLGEVYTRTLATKASDSLASASLRRALELDGDFAPALLLLEELALENGDVEEMLRLQGDLRRAGADTTHAIERSLILGCVRPGPAPVKWADNARRDAASTINAGRVLSRRMSFPSCAAAAFGAVLRTDTTTGLRWGALLGLHGLLVASNRAAEIPSIFSSKGAAKLPVRKLYLAGAAAGAGFEREADAAADSIGRRIEREGAQTLWLLGSWAARKKDWAQLRRVARLARDLADSSRSRQSALVVRLLEARLPLANGDTNAAIERLRALRPTAPRRDIAWSHVEGLGAERLLLAELLLAKGRYPESIGVASLLDATEPVPYLLYLRPSLVVRARAATAAGNKQLADEYERRLRALEQPQVVAPAKP